MRKREEQTGKRCWQQSKETGRGDRKTNIAKKVNSEGKNVKPKQ